jgi:transcription elongation factor Elf1
MEFICAHCGGGSLGIVDVADKIVTVECLSCGKEFVIEREVVSTPPVPPPIQRSQ